MVCTRSLQSDDPSHVCLMSLAFVGVDEGYYRNDYPDADTDEWSSNEGGERSLTFFYSVRPSCVVSLPWAILY